LREEIRFWGEFSILFHLCHVLFPFKDN
jgi:hypothetical protein